MKYETLLLLIVSVVFFVTPLYADVPNDYLTAGEFFFDIDPGEGNGFPFISSDGNFDDAEESVNFSSDLPELTSGPHYLYVRFCNSTGVWGIANRQLINVTNDNSVVAAEFYIDTDPGKGLGQELAVVDSKVSEEFNLPSHLEEGMHTLYLRMKDVEDSWGPERKYQFEVKPWSGNGYIQAAEFYIDSDPGVGNGTQMVPVDGDFDQTEEYFFDRYRTSPLAIGTHTLYIRFQNEFGYWTLPAAYKTFQITPFDDLVGDLNNDDLVDLQDVILALMVVAGESPIELREDYVSSGVDVDNWEVGLPDLLNVLKTVAEE